MTLFRRAPLRSALSLTAFAALVPLLALACSAASLPRPATGPHREADFSVVSQPPPAPRPQTLTPRPGPQSVWVDGEWVAAADNAWSWQPGGWVQPPEGARLATWQLQWLPDGRLRYAPSVFHVPGGGEPVALSTLLGLDVEAGAQRPTFSASVQPPALATFVPPPSASLPPPLVPLVPVNDPLPPLSSSPAATPAPQASASAASSARPRPPAPAPAAASSSPPLATRP